MAVLNIALLGACPVQLSELAGALDDALQRRDCQRMLVTAGNASALPAGLAGFELVLLAGREAPVHEQHRLGLGAALHHEAADRSIRAALALAGVSYRVLYGTADERLAHALHAVESLLSAATRPRQANRPDGLKNQPWVWMCDKCSDPQCEHRLLTALLAGRDRTAAAAVNAWGKQVRLY